MTNLAATGGVPGPGRIGRVAIGDLLRKSARRSGNRIALTDGALQVSYAELERDANRFANYPRKGRDASAVMTRNSSDGTD
jgi:long-chain acyl-CoA synthetase